MALPFQVTVGPLTAASANNIALSQSPGAGAITLNGSLVSSGVATLDQARSVRFTSGGNDSGITFTVTGTNFAGNPLTETIAGSNGSTADTTQDFKTVSSVTHSGSVATTLTIGTNGVASSAPYIVDTYAMPIFIGLAVVVSGTINYTVEYTMDDVNAPYTGTFPTWFSFTPLASQTANGSSAISAPVAAVRLTVNSNTNPATAKMIATQAGLGA